MINTKELTALLDGYGQKNIVLSNDDLLIVNDSKTDRKKGDEIAAYASSFMKKKKNVHDLSFIEKDSNVTELTEKVEDKFLLTVIFDKSESKDKITELNKKYIPHILTYLHEGDSSKIRTKVPGFESYH